MAERPREMDEFLNEPRMARISTVSAGGLPHSVPLCYKFDSGAGTFFISTGSDSVTVKNLKHNPAVSLCIDDDEFPFRAVIVEGAAEVSREMGTDHEGLRSVIDQFFGPDMWANYKDGPVAQKIRVRITVFPARWKWWDYRRKLGGSVKVD
jgi:PPOX class probable F420-dependent enzyme